MDLKYVKLDATEADDVRPVVRGRCVMMDINSIEIRLRQLERAEELRVRNHKLETLCTPATIEMFMDEVERYAQYTRLNGEECGG